MNISDNIKRIRKENNLSQEELAEKLGVSRQSVSKWESGQAYPEMDKIIDISKKFNISIEELFNQNVTTTKNTNEAKNSLDSFVKRIINFITNSFNMFFRMKFKDKLKLIIEELIIVGLLYLLLGLAYSVIEDLLYRLIDVKFIINIFTFVYTIFAYGLGFIVLINLFKTRYLDYYLNMDNKKDNEEENNKNNNKFELKKEEKIIIRDEKDSHFLDTLANIFIFLFKCVVFPCALSLCFSFIFLVMTFILSFTISSTGSTFIGVILVVISCLVINYILLKICFDILFSHKSNKLRLGAIFLGSLVVCGIGAGIFVSDLPNYRIASYKDDIVYNHKEFKLDKNYQLGNHLYYNVEYEETDNDDIILEIYYLKNSNPIVELEDNKYSFYYNYKERLDLSYIKDILKLLENKIIINDGETKLIIKANKASIDLLKNRD